MTLQELNNLSFSEAYIQLETCCVSKNWITSMVNSRPIESIDQLMNISNRAWQKCTKQDFLEAFKGHPKIGDVSSLAKKYANTSDLAANEQSGVDSANDEIIKLLAKGNQEYEKKFGFIFIVCATGKSAKEMLYLLEERIQNNIDEELDIAAGEQHKITTIRLEKLLK